MQKLPEIKCLKVKRKIYNKILKIFFNFLRFIAGSVNNLNNNTIKSVKNKKKFLSI